MKRYPKYKDSGVPWLGQVPAHWEVKRCKHYLRERNLRSVDGAETLLSVSEYFGVKPRAEAIDDGDVLVRAKTLVDYKVCRAGDFVMNIMLAWKRAYGVTKYEGIVSPAYAVFRFTSDHVVPEYLHYLLRTDIYADEFKRNSSGVIDSRLRLYPEEFFRVPFLVPPISEQKVVVRFLDDATSKMDAAIASQERMIELLKERRSAIITQAVTKGLDPKAKMKDSGVPWLGKVPAHWVVVKLNRLIDSRRPITYGIVQAGEDHPGGVKYIRPVDMTESSGVKDETTLKTTSPQIALQYKRSEVKAGDVVFSIGPSYGKVMIVPPSLEGANLTQGTARLAVSSAVSKEFLCHALRSSASKAQWDMSVGGATFGGLNLKPLSRTMLALPPLSEQMRIAGFLDGIMNRLDDAISSQERMIELLKERRSAIVTQAVTGQIDVR